MLLFNLSLIKYPNEQSMLKLQNLYPSSIFPEMINKTKPRTKLSGGTH